MTQRVSVRLIAAIAASVAVSPAVAADAVATFELRLPGGAPSTVLTPSEQLTLEIWMSLDATNQVDLVSVFMDLDAVTESGLVSYNSGSFSNSGLFLASLPSGTDNTPVSGEFAAGVQNLFTPPTFQAGIAQKVAEFTITALDPGPGSFDLTYAFGDNGASGPWKVSFPGSGEDVALAQLESPLITIVPEPSAMLLAVMGCLALGYRRRSGR